MVVISKLGFYILGKNANNTPQVCSIVTLVL